VWRLVLSVAVTTLERSKLSQAGQIMDFDTAAAQREQLPLAKIDRAPTNSAGMTVPAEGEGPWHRWRCCLTSYGCCSAACGWPWLGVSPPSSWPLRSSACLGRERLGFATIFAVLVFTSAVVTATIDKALASAAVVVLGG
jgi:hypothetical protein